MQVFIAKKTGRYFGSMSIGGVDKQINVLIEIMAEIITL